MILILPKFLGLDGVWFAQPTADAISSILTAIVIFKEFRSYEKTEDKLEEYLKKSNGYCTKSVLENGAIASYPTSL